VNDLFTCHVVDWKKISPNWVEGKLFKKKKTSTHYLHPLMGAFAPFIYDPWWVSCEFDVLGHAT
jgi:hypothetical protein